jgi:predicted MFS family arabinose efflux permease
MKDVASPGATGTTVPARSSTTASILALSVVAVLVVLLTDTQGLALIPLVGQMKIDFALATTQVGWILTATQLAGAATAPALLRMGEMFGMRKILLGSLVLGAAGNVICAVAPNGQDSTDREWGHN